MRHLYGSWLPLENLYTSMVLTVESSRISYQTGIAVSIVEIPISSIQSTAHMRAHRQSAIYSHRTLLTLECAAPIIHIDPRVLIYELLRSRRMI